MLNMIFNLIIFSICIYARVDIPSTEISKWNVIQDDHIWIGWIKENNIDWCRSYSIIDAPISQVKILIEDKKNYPNIFKRIEKTEIINDNIVYIALDMPFPFAGRDYIVEYIQFEEENSYYYQYSAIENIKFPPYDHYVRLVNSMGEWKLTSLDQDKTQVSYTWNGELRGDFPKWALTQAWTKQSIEIFSWIEEALE